MNEIELIANSFDEWRIDFVALAEVLRKRRTYVADVATMRAIFVNLSAALGAPASAIEQLCALEVGFPTDYSTYRSTMRGGANNHYVGVTQAGRDFWIDVRTYRPALSLPINREDATIEMQIAAPFIYAERYRAVMIARGFPFSIEFVYALHQQGVGAARGGFRKIAGTQSPRSLKVIRAVQSYSKNGQPKELSL